MVTRHIKLPKKHSFMLFGARGTGKSYLLQHHFTAQTTKFIDLLQPDEEDRYARNPGMLEQVATELPKNIEWIVIDEIQKVPRLLDVVHRLIEHNKICFALTGSSARKLKQGSKQGSANMLAGRAFVLNLYPLTHRELGESFNLQEAIEFGTLPHLTHLDDPEERKRYLRTYGRHYLKEEVWAEHLIRELDPFRAFLEIAAQASGEIVNYSRIAADVGVDRKTIQTYFQILDDTLLGFVLEAYHTSVRKRQRKAHKFYLFDTGVKRALDNTLVQPVVQSTYGFGKLFEHFVILECLRLNSYAEKDYRFYYLLTGGNVEVDLIIERPGMKLALVEIKSTTRVDERVTGSLESLRSDFKNAEFFCLSQDPVAKRIGSVRALPWQEGLMELGL